MYQRLSPMMLRAIISVWYGVNLSMGGSSSTGLSSPKDSTCGGRPTVKRTSETSGCDSSIAVRTWSSSGRRMLILVFGWVCQERTEFFPVERFFVRVFRRDTFHAQMFHN